MASHCTAANSKAAMATKAKDPPTRREWPRPKCRGRLERAWAVPLAWMAKGTAGCAAPQDLQNRAPGDSSPPHRTQRAGEAGAVGSMPIAAPQCRQKRAPADTAPPHEGQRAPGLPNRSATCPPPRTQRPTEWAAAAPGGQRRRGGGRMIACQQAGTCPSIIANAWCPVKQSKRS